MPNPLLPPVMPTIDWEAFGAEPLSDEYFALLAKEGLSRAEVCERLLSQEPEERRRGLVHSFRRFLGTVCWTAEQLRMDEVWMARLVERALDELERGWLRRLREVQAAELGAVDAG